VTGATSREVAGTEVWVETPRLPCLERSEYTENVYFSVSPDSKLRIGRFCFRGFLRRDRRSSIKVLRRAMTFMTNSVGRSPTCAFHHGPLQFPLRLLRSADPENYRDHDEYFPGPSSTASAAFFCTSVFERFASPAVSRSSAMASKTTSPSPCPRRGRPLDDYQRHLLPNAATDSLPPVSADSTSASIRSTLPDSKASRVPNRHQGHGRHRSRQNSRSRRQSERRARSRPQRTMKSNPSQNLRASAA